MAQHLCDLRPCAAGDAPDHRRTGTLAGGRRDRFDPVPERPGRSQDSHEPDPAVRSRAVTQARDERLADIDWQRQPVLTVALAMNNNLARPPVKIIELEPGDLPGTQPSRTINNTIA